MLTRHKTNTIRVIISMVKEKGEGRFMVPAAYIWAALLMHKMPDRQKVPKKNLYGCNNYDISRCGSTISVR